MGMFDTVIVQYPLPDEHKPDPDEVFQTKDLECELDSYTITAEGRMIHHWHRMEWDKEKMLFVSVANEDRDTKYHGDLRIYTHLNDEWFEYQVRFTHGTVEFIKRVVDA